MIGVNRRMTDGNSPFAPLLLQLIRQTYWGMRLLARTAVVNCRFAMGSREYGSGESHRIAQLFSSALLVSPTWATSFDREAEMVREDLLTNSSQQRTGPAPMKFALQPYATTKATRSTRYSPVWPRGEPLDKTMRPSPPFHLVKRRDIFMHDCFHKCRSHGFVDFTATLTNRSVPPRWQTRPSPLSSSVAFLLRP